LVQWRTIGVGEEKDGLFYLMKIPGKSSTNSRTFHVSLKDPSTDLWHFRLDHLSSPRLNLLHNLIPSISVDFDEVCNVCPLAKQKHLSFPINNKVSKFPFDHVHIDIWFFFSQQSTNGSHYFLTIVDDFSRYTWVHLMAQKSQTRLLVQSFFKLVATQFNLKIKILRSDNGLKFHMDEFLTSQGTLHQHNYV
jgi:transposase InsO family protein